MEGANVYEKWSRERTGKTMTEKTSGQVIRYYREQQAFTREELAQMLNVTQGKLTHWEDGVTVPRPAMIAQLVSVLDIPEQDAQILHRSYQEARTPRLSQQAVQKAVVDAQNAEEERFVHRQKATSLFFIGMVGFLAGFLFCFVTGAHKDFPWYGPIAIGWAISGIPFGWKLLSPKSEPDCTVRYYSLLDLALRMIFYVIKFIGAYLVGIVLFPVVLFHHTYKACRKDSAWQKIMGVLLSLVIVFVVILAGGLILSSIR